MSVLTTAPSSCRSRVVRYTCEVSTATTQPQQTVRIETEAIYAAFCAGALGAILGVIVTWSGELGFWGWPSLGSFAAFSAAAVGAAAAAIAYTRSSHMPDQAWRRALPRWRGIISTISVTAVHAALAALATAVIYLIFGLGFIGLTLRPFEGAISAAVTTGLAAWLVYLSASRTNTQRLSSMLLSYVALGTLTAMAASPEPTWWKSNFSELGTFGTFSSFAFNTTLIAAGLLVTTFAAYVETDVSKLVADKRLPERRSATVIPALFVVMGVMFALVGFIPVNEVEVLHNIAASGIAVVFLVMLCCSPWVLRGMPRAFFLSEIVIGIALIAAVVLFVTGFFDLTALEIAVFALIFGWITVFIRFLGVTGQHDGLERLEAAV